MSCKLVFIVNYSDTAIAMKKAENNRFFVVLRHVCSWLKASFRLCRFLFVFQPLL